MKQKLEFIQKQQLSPKLIHSMNILQMGFHELTTLINTHMLENPFIAVADNESQAIQYIESQQNFKQVKKNNNNIQEFDIIDNSEIDIHSHVSKQLAMHSKSKKDEQVLRFLVESLDSKGYLTENISEICKMFDLTNKEGLAYLRLLQSVEPKGIGARNLTECLLLQLGNDENLALAKKMITSYLTYIGNHKYKEIAKKENVSLKEVEVAVSIIKSLNPIPANGFSHREITTYIIPDAYILTNNDEMIVELNNGLSSKLTMNTNSFHIYKHTNLDKDSKDFLSQKLYDYKLLHYCTTRRNITLKKLITALVSYQRTFFKTGQKRNLKPLRLIDIERMTGLHSSTISRALQDKYFQCNYGLYPLRTLVPRTYAKKGKSTVSRNLIKEELQEIIRYEDKQNPYSDQQIQLLLEEDGFSISRRSVSTYREELHIPPSTIRKKLS